MTIETSGDISRMILHPSFINLSNMQSAVNTPKSGNANQNFNGRQATIGQFHHGGQFRRNGKIWVRVLADLLITGKPTKVRMGRGKGNPTGWIACVSTGQILFEMDGFVKCSTSRYISST
ncbi:hypothetical protein Pint_09940 [Pistacia integerrima]|uniref:Uncharacterized protein n=1 Tax=Pistacia integerrima TaxID=434235 RepID=A0ACC0XJY5_9ROSI|nr:hypothetical protein Pint_09940 [Pistacia integerrima]